jgi:hypothetical protein
MWVHAVKCDRRNRLFWNILDLMTDKAKFLIYFKMCVDSFEKLYRVVK